MISRNLEPKWQHQNTLRRYAVAPALLSWLLDSNSTTQRFKNEYGQIFQVHILNHQWQRPNISESNILDLPSRINCLTREVALTHENKIWMYARSIFPMQALRGKWQQLKKIGNQSLGSLIHKNCLLERSKFEIALIKPGHKDYQLATQNIATPPNQLWGRRSLFYLEFPFLLTEIFFHPWVDYVEK